ncbi:WAT1-related protein [Pycnococcus provasolii]
MSSTGSSSGGGGGGGGGPCGVLVASSVLDVSEDVSEDDGGGDDDDAKLLFNKKTHPVETIDIHASSSMRGGNDANPTVVPRLVYMLLILNQFLFVGLHLTGHAALKYVPPTFYTLMRISIGMPFIAALARTEGPLWDEDVKEVAPKAAALGVVGVTLAQWLVLEGNNRAGAAITAAMQPVIPVLSAIFSFFLGVEAFTAAKCIAVSIATLGALGLTHIDEGASHRGKETATGILALAAQVTAYATFLVGMGRLLRGRGNVSLRAFVFATLSGWVVIAFANMIICLNDINATVQWMKAAPPLAWLGAVYAGVFVSFVAHSSQNYCVARASSTTVALFGTIQPLVGVVLAVLIFNDPWELRDGAFMLMIVGGVVGVVLVDTRAKPELEFKELSPNESEANAAPAPEVELTNVL